MNALGITRDLGADDAGRVGLQLGAAHPADGLAAYHLDIECTGRRAIVRTGGMADFDLGVLVHGKGQLTPKAPPAECLYPAFPAHLACVGCGKRRPMWFPALGPGDTEAIRLLGAATVDPGRLPRKSSFIPTA